MRLDKYLCDNLGLTRAEAKKNIAKGKVTVNGIVVKKPEEKIDENSNDIRYEGQPVNHEKFSYYMLNKPAGIVSANTDNVDITVIDLFKDEKKKNLSCVGRLDKDTTGLMLVTNDGALLHRLTSPKHHVFKDYLVTLRDEIDENSIRLLEEGVDIGDDTLTKPARVTVTDDKTIILSISEGRFHQVKRMLKAVSNEVIALKRLSIGNLRLDDNLAEGKYRKLTKEEIEELLSC